MAYNHSEIEAAAQKKWEELKLYQADDDSKKPKEYVLDMFPYPSGAGLHTGHVESYAATDIYARFARMQGKNVLHPIGWDAFGLPAENYAIKTKTPPRVSTDKAIENFRRQIKSLGLSYDWSREIGTHTPEYYQWTQWFFLLLYKHGLAYKKKAKVNWCPQDQTVLANEQVVDGVCERCGATVEQKDLEQWFFKITEYADELLAGLDTIDWPDSTKAAQRNWIGKSEGAEIVFALSGRDERINVFTTRPDTLFGATYLVLAPEHVLSDTLAADAENTEEVRAYIAAAAHKTDLERNAEGKEKTGVELQGLKAVNPATKEEIPVFIADYVFGSYGTGAIMAVPAHDERDFEFATKFNLPIRQVVVPCADDPNNPPQEGFKEVKRDTVIVHVKDVSTGKYAILDWHGTLEGITTAIMGGIEEGQTPEEAALMEIREEAAFEGVRITRKLRWITSARYCASHKGENRVAHTYALLAEIDSTDGQGEIASDEQAKHTLVWVDEKDVLNRLVPAHQKQVWQLLHKEEALTGDGYLINSGAFDGRDNREAMREIAESVGGKMVTTYRLRDWLVSRQRYWGAPIPIIYCDTCGTVPVPEEDLPVLLPEDVDFAPTGESPLARSKSFHQVSCPTCGKPARRESDTMDTFVCSSWYYYRFTDPHNAHAFASASAIKKWLPVDLYVGGAEHSVLHLLYSRFFTKVLHSLGYTSFDEPFQKLRHQGMILAEDGRKMSKSLGNVINPDDVVNEYGADTLRVYEMFMGPIDVQKPWNTQNITGAHRFIERSYRLLQKRTDKEPESFAPVLHETIKKVGEDINELKFNTAISQLMICLNAAEDGGVSDNSLQTYAQLLAPFAPHLAEALWEALGQDGSVHESEWPQYDGALLAAKTVTVAVQVNGKRRGEVQLAPDATEDDALAAARGIASIDEALSVGAPKRVIYVAGRILNIVV